MLFEIQQTVYSGSKLRMLRSHVFDKIILALDVLFVISKGTSVCGIKRDVPESIQIASWCVPFFFLLRDLTKSVSGSYR